MHDQANSIHCLLHIHTQKSNQYSTVENTNTYCIILHIWSFTHAPQRSTCIQEHELNLLAVYPITLLAASNHLDSIPFC